MKKGFTLIELLGVIIILSIIILLVMPNIINTIKKSNTNTSNMMADIIYTATKKYIDSHDKYKNSKGNTYCITIKELVDDGLLDTPVKYGDENNIEDTKSVKATYNNSWNYSIVNKTECVTESDFICNRTTTSGSTAVTSGYIPQNKYHVGDEYICKVNSTLSYHFFILNVSGNKVSLIADRNLQNNGTLVDGATNATGWASGNNNTIGPINAYTYLNTNTSNWTNIPTIKNFSFVDRNKDNNYGYNGVNIEFSGNNYITNIYGSDNTINQYTNMRTRLPMYNELYNAGCTEIDGTCPEWLTGHIGSGKDIGYWVLDSGQDTGNMGTFVTYNINRLSKLTTSHDACGIRPVIELNKGNLE